MMFHYGVEFNPRLIMEFLNLYEITILPLSLIFLLKTRFFMVAKLCGYISIDAPH